MNPFKKRKTESTYAIILDTSGIIDGRILAIAKTGFIPQRVIVPQFVIAELQYLADTGDSMKRERARFGLDVIRELQDSRRTSIMIAREQFKNIREVDDKLIALAKQYGALLYTTDYNLNKVAQIEGVTVLNVNELAQALRPPRLPGERVEIKITQIGQDKTQGVGYLEDGTMVVVEGASRLLGQRVLVQFSRMLQTQAGKMMFAVLPQAADAQAAAVTRQPLPVSGASYHSEHHFKPHDQALKMAQTVPIRPQQPPHPAQPASGPQRRVQSASRPTQTPRPQPPVATTEQSKQQKAKKWQRRKKSAEDSLLAAVQNQK